MAAAAAPAIAMPMAKLGRSGLVVSRLSYGAWVSFSYQIGTDSATQTNQESEGAYALMLAAYKAGINFFDNAEAYAAGKAETIMGECIARGIQQGEWTREDLVISTKIYFGLRPGFNSKGLSRKHIIEGTNASLKRLGLDYVDVLFCHRPDPVTPIEETVRAMNHVIDKGQAFYWGTSMWSAVQIEEAIAICDRLGLIRPICEQPEYNIFARDKLEGEYVPLFRKYGLGTTIWSPLASGVLTGKYAGGNIPEGARLGISDYQFLKDAKLGNDRYQIDKTELLRPVAEKLGCSLAQLAVAWTLKNDDCTTTILGATKLSQLNENLQALEVVPKLTPEVMAEIDAIVGNKPQPTKVEAQVANIRKYAGIHGLYR